MMFGIFSGMYWDYGVLQAMWYHVITWRGTEVLEEPSVSIFMVKLQAAGHLGLVSAPHKDRELSNLVLFIHSICGRTPYRLQMLEEGNKVEMIKLCTPIHFNIIFLIFSLHRMTKLAMVIMYNVEHVQPTNLEASPCHNSLTKVDYYFVGL